MYDRKPLERRNAVKEMRENGMTFKEIGKQMNVSASRANQLYQSALRYDKYVFFENELYLIYLRNSNKAAQIRMNVSVRAINALRRNKIDTREKLINLTAEDIKKMRAVGEKLFHEIMLLKEVIQYGEI